jgi:hypothetical protein
MKKFNMNFYTQEDVDEFCSDIYFDFFVDLIDSGHIFNLDIGKIILNIIESDGIKLFKLFESKGLIEFSKEKVMGWLIFSYIKESYSIIAHFKFKYFNLYMNLESDKKYFLQNCLVALSEYGKLDMILELDNIYQIDWSELVIIDKEQGDKINQISETRFKIYSELETNINQFGFETSTYNSFSLGNKMLVVICTYSDSLSKLKLEKTSILEFVKYIRSKIDSIDTKIIQKLFSRSFEFDNLEFSQWLYSLDIIDIKEKTNNPLLQFFSSEYCNQIDLFMWLGTLDKRKDVLNTILLKLSSSHCYPKISQQTKLDMFKYFIDLGGNILDNYHNLFLGCFARGDYLVLEYLSNSNYSYDYSLIFQSNVFIDVFERTYKIALFNEENNHTFITDELQLFNGILKCKLVIRLGYKPNYTHELFDYYKSIYQQIHDK